VFVRGAAIRPVPAWAVVDRNTLENVEQEIARLSDDDDSATLDGSFERFETNQPLLAEKMNGVLGRPLDNTALALGYFLTIAIWLAFEEQFPNRVETVSSDGLEAVETSLSLEEELRSKLPVEPLEVDEVVACAQPGVMAFVNEHIEAALETTTEPDESGTPREVDVDDVHLVYRALLVLALALSHAVRPLGGEATRGGTEMMA
jgi:hypothetical protein